MKQSKSPRQGSDPGPFPKEDAGDITGRQQAQRPPRDREPRYRDIVEALDGLIYICSPDYRVEFMNPRLIKRTGYDGTGEYCYKVLHGLDSICPWCASERVFGGETLRWEVQSPKDHRWYYVVNTPIYHRDGRVSKQGIMQDITEFKQAAEASRQAQAELERRVEEGNAHLEHANEKLLGEIEEGRQIEDRLRESEARFLAFMQYLPGGAVIRDLQGRYLFANKAWDKAFAKKWQGKSLEEIWPVDTVRSIRELDQRALITGQAAEALVNLEQQDGTHTWLINHFPILDKDGRPALVGSVGLDITDRHRTQEALKESEGRFRQLVEYAADELVLHDNGRIIEVNQQTCEDLGYSREELLKMTVYDLEVGISPQDLQKLWEQGTESSFTVRGVHRRKDGSTFPVEVRVARLIYGGRRLLLAMARDITERQQAEEALRQSELKYRRLVVAAPFGISIIDKTNGRYKYLNPKFEKMFGYTLGDIPTGREWFPKAFPDESYREMVISNWKEEFKKTQLGEATPRTFRVRCKDGTTKVINFRAVALVTGEWLIFYEDITEHVKAEEALTKSEASYRLLAENVSDVIWTADMNLNLTYVSPSAQVLFGFAPEEIIHRGMEATLTPVSLELARRIFAEEMAADLEESRDLSRSRIFEMEMVRKDGSIVWAEVKASFLRNEQGRPLGILGVSRDISKRKRVELALRRREAILEAVSFAAEKFLQTESWEKDIENILKRLGQSADASRVYIFENHLNEAGDLLTSQRYEWTAAGIEPQITNPKMINLSWHEAGFDRWKEQLSRGQIIVGHAWEFPPSEQELLSSQDIKSIVIVPIFVGQQWWGVIGLDECPRERQWSPVELEALKTAASILGAAILHGRDEQDLRKSEQKLRSLTAQLLSAQENERKRLAGELHDELGHALLTLKLSIRSLEKELTPEQQSLKKSINKILQSIGGTLDEIRRLYHDLSPGDLEVLGLTTALQNMVEDFLNLYPNIKGSVNLENLDGLFSVPVNTAVYRIMQEALTNIGKHAKAKHISILAEKENHHISLTIADDGRGFEATKALEAKRSLGLLTMEERVKILGGTFNLQSQEKRGTRISFTVPFSKER